MKLVEPEGTYMIWLDASEYGYTAEQMHTQLRTKARLWLNEGSMFGPEGAAFLRVNIASPRSVICEAMERLLQF